MALAIQDHCIISIQKGEAANFRSVLGFLKTHDPIGWDLPIDYVFGDGFCNENQVSNSKYPFQTFSLFSYRGLEVP